MLGSACCSFLCLISLFILVSGLLKGERGSMSCDENCMYILHHISFWS